MKTSQPLCNGGHNSTLYSKTPTDYRIQISNAIYTQSHLNAAAALSRKHASVYSEGVNITNMHEVYGEVTTAKIPLQSITILTDKDDAAHLWYLR